MYLGKDTENGRFSFNNITFENSDEKKTLGITIDNILNFKSHIKVCWYL